MALRAGRRAFSPWALRRLVVQLHDRLALVGAEQLHRTALEVIEAVGVTNRRLQRPDVRRPSGESADVSSASCEQRRTTRDPVHQALMKTAGSTS
jgi:hypothetical protein